MAKVRVFISSTSDFLQIRGDLDGFINQMGYESVRHEKGSIPYGRSDALEEYCYRELNRIDILIALIGGKFGSESNHGKYSITQMEIKTALNKNKQVYLFIEKNVYVEYQLYLQNKNNETIVYRKTGDKRIFQFIEELEALPQNNVIQPFETAQDVIDFLKAQWSGLFQIFLEQQTRVKEVNLIKGLESTAKNLEYALTLVTDEKKRNENLVREILLTNHPAIAQLKNILKVKYKVYFTNFRELTEWLEARNYKLIKDYGEFYQWKYRNPNSRKEFMLNISSEIFDSNRKLKTIRAEDWDDKLIFEEEVKTMGARDYISFGN